MHREHVGARRSRFPERLKVRSHQKPHYFSRRSKRVSLLARPFTVFTP